VLLLLMSAAAAAQAPVAEPCEVHVWQTTSYISGSPAPYAAYGLLGAALQGAHDSKYPANSVVGLMAYELRPEALGPLIESAPWGQYLSAQSVRAIIEPVIVDKDRIKTLRAVSTRNSASTAACYVELYLSDQTFEGGFVKSHLFNNFTVRQFGSGYTVGNAIVWSELKQFPAKDEATLPIARQNFQKAFLENLGKFLGKKLKR